MGDLKDPINRKLNQLQESTTNQTSEEEKGKRNIVIQDILAYCGVPPLYRNARLDDFDKIVIDDLTWGRGNMHGIFLTGEVGSGKTHAAAALLADAFESNRLPEKAANNDQVKWILVPELLLNIREAFSKKSESERELVMKYIKPEILVMDDLGVEKVTDWSTSTLYLIIAKRIENLKVTILTSNLSFQQLEEWEPRIASRLYMLAKIDLGDTDRRVQGG